MPSGRGRPWPVQLPPPAEVTPAPPSPTGAVAGEPTARRDSRRPGVLQARQVLVRRAGSAAWPRRRSGCVGKEIRHRGRQGGAIENRVAYDLVRLPVHPEHVVRMVAPEREHHASDTGCELSGRYGGWKSRTIHGCNRALLPCPVREASLTRTMLKECRRRLALWHNQARASDKPLALCERERGWSDDLPRRSSLA